MWSQVTSLREIKLSFYEQCVSTQSAQSVNYAYIWVKWVTECVTQLFKRWLRRAVLTTPDLLEFRTWLDESPPGVGENSCLLRNGRLERSKFAWLSLSVVLWPTVFLYSGHFQWWNHLSNENGLRMPCVSTPQRTLMSAAYAKEQDVPPQGHVLGVHFV
jgi:hypothetical protein